MYPSPPYSPTVIEFIAPSNKEVRHSSCTLELNHSSNPKALHAKSIELSPNGYGGGM